MPSLIIGLTGGLASGKTTVLGFFQHLGIDTLSADVTIHRLMAKNGLAYSAIVEHFSNDILSVDHNIDKAKLRALIFNSVEEKHWLESYLHPLVRQALFEQSKLATSPYAVIEIPLLAESLTNYKWLDRILVIDTDEEAQQQRAYLRSGLSKNESRQILDHQTTRQKRNSIADDLIINHGDLAELELQVKELHKKYLEFSQH